MTMARSRIGLGGGQVLLQEQGRDRQDVADVVEAVADVVVGEVGGRLEVDADEVADRVVILGPVEPADRDAAVVARPAAVELVEQVFDGPGRQLDLRGDPAGAGPWPWAASRRSGPSPRRFPRPRGPSRSPARPDTCRASGRRLILAAAVAGVAMLGQEGDDVLLEAGRGGFLGRSRTARRARREATPPGSRARPPGSVMRESQAA